jgi:C4-type Zn-finger protein
MKIFCVSCGNQIIKTVDLVEIEKEKNITHSPFKCNTCNFTGFINVLEVNDKKSVIAIQGFKK